MKHNYGKCFSEVAFHESTDPNTSESLMLKRISFRQDWSAGRLALQLADRLAFIAIILQLSNSHAF